MSEHTPTPWAIGERCRLIVRDVPGMCDGGDYYSVAEAKFHSLLTPEEGEANAAFIVKAVNSHDALVEALRRIHAFPYVGFKASQEMALIAGEALHGVVGSPTGERT